MAVRLVVRHADAAPAGDSAHTVVGYEFEQSRLLVGRSASADLRLPALTVSERHATLEQTERGYALRDEGSTNGTLVNGTPLVPGRPRSLHDGDELRVGEFVVEFHTGGLVSGLTTPERTVSLAKRLLAEVTSQPTSGARLIWECNGTPRPDVAIPAPPVRWLLGRDPEAFLHVEDLDVSRRQLELEVDLDGVCVRDLGSKNGMLVNGKSMRERRLHDGDEVTIGSVRLRLDDPAERALGALVGRGDQPYVPTAPLQPAAAASAGEIQTPERAAAPAPESQGGAAPSLGKTSERPSLGLDAVIYGLALAVLTASGFGLVWLLSD